MEKILDVNQNAKDALKKFQDTKNREHEKTHKQIKELREKFNKYQSETKDTLERKIYELKRTAQIIKEELNKDVGNLRRKNQREILEIKSPYSQTNKQKNGSPLQQVDQVEGRLSELQDKIEIKEKKKE
jgi:hypothetical protein